MVSATYEAQINDFLTEVFKRDLDKIAGAYPDQRSLEIDYNQVDRFSPELADEFIENPLTLLSTTEETIVDMGLKNAAGETVKPKVRLFNLPEDVLIRDINNTHINKLMSIDCVLTKITDVRPKVHKAVFKCTFCGRTHVIEQKAQLFEQLKEPDRCSCGKGTFALDLDETEFVDVQKMEVQEPLEVLTRGEAAKTIPVWLEEDLTNHLFAGDKVKVVGILRLIPPKQKKSVYSIYLHAIHVLLLEKEFEDIDISEEEEEEIKRLSKDPDIYKKITESIAPTIYGYKEVKEALALQLFGGSKNKIFPDGARVRPDMHVLLIGDPGTAKSQILYYIHKLAPKAVLVGGKSASGAGLTATAEKDEFGEGGWTLKAGALVLASGGHALIDEFDKMGVEDRSAMHEAMEQQRINIAKAGIIATFKAETSILAAANPKFGRFDQYEPLAGQFNIPPTLLSRFDLIFPISDVVDEKKDRKMADHILSAHQVAGMISEKTTRVLTKKELEKAEERIMPAIDSGILRKYIAYARKTVRPVLTTEAMSKIEEYYVDFRKMGKHGAVPTTPRQLEALVRFSEASAKGRLSSIVEVEDSERAIRLHQFSMKAVGLDRETGGFDYDIIATGRPKSKVDKMRALYNIIRDLCTEKDIVTHELIIEAAKESGLPLKDIDKMLTELKRNGDIYTPRHGEYKTADSTR